MGFWNRGRESDLERQLRAQRPRPSDDFVRSLGRLVEPARRPRRVATPKLALVAAVTALLAASLGAAGAFGYASHSVHSFGTSISDLWSTPHATNIAVVQSSSPAVRSSASTSHESTDATPTDTPPPPTPQEYEQGGLHTPAIPPFHRQYGIRIPICWQGHIIFVSPRELVWYIFHGAKPFWFCFRR